MVSSIHPRRQKRLSLRTQDVKEILSNRLKSYTFINVCVEKGIQTDPLRLPNQVGLRKALVETLFPLGSFAEPDTFAALAVLTGLGTLSGLRRLSRLRHYHRARYLCLATCHIVRIFFRRARLLKFASFVLPLLHILGPCALCLTSSSSTELSSSSLTKEHLALEYSAFLLGMVDLVVVGHVS